MNPTITNAAIDQFSHDVRMAYQQMTSRAEAYVTNDPLAAESGFFDFMGTVKAVRRTGRGQKVQETPPDIERRKCSQQVWEASIWEDKFEKKILSGPMSQKAAMAISAALARQKDAMICGASIGTAYGGRDGTTSIAFPTATQQIASTYREDGTSVASDITTGKVRRAIRSLVGAEAVPNDNNALVTIFYASPQLQSLLAICEAVKNQTAYDALQSGKPTVVAMGCNWVRMADDILPYRSTNVRSIICVVPDAVHWCSVGDISLEVNYVPTEKSWLISGDFQGDAARLRDKGVVEILCDESTIP